jgi:hypothetical protein
MCQALLVADSGSGISAVLDGAGFIFINVDLTVALTRDPPVTGCSSKPRPPAPTAPAWPARSCRTPPAYVAPAATCCRPRPGRADFSYGSAAAPVGIARGMTSDLPICRTCGAVRRAARGLPDLPG